jgi:hypothetical protein
MALFLEEGTLEGFLLSCPRGTSSSEDESAMVSLWGLAVGRGWLVENRLVFAIMSPLLPFPPANLGDTRLLRRYDLDKYIHKKVFDLIR